MRAIVYGRVSTDAQERDGTSLDTQERACLDYARARSWQLIDAIRDTVSGFTLERAGIERVRQAVRRGEVDVVLAYAVDRLSRNQNHIGVLFDEFEQHAVKLEFVTEKFEDTAIGRFILAARAFIAEIEREKIVERTTRGKAERARSGRLPQATGKGIYGYVYNAATGTREINASQAAVVRRIYRRYAETKSFSAVSQELNAEAVPAFLGGRWYPLTVRAVLRNPTYTGLTVYRRTRRTKTRGRPSRVVERPSDEWIQIDGASPRIVDDELWQRVHQLLDDPERLRRRPEGRRYPLGGRSRCGICGSAMVGQTLTTRGKPYSYYRCRHVYDNNSTRHCTAKYIRADVLEGAVWSEVERILTHPHVVLAELSRNPSEAVATTGDLEEIKTALAAVDAKQRKLVRLFSSNDVDETIVQAELRALKGERAVLETERARMTRDERPTVTAATGRQVADTCSQILRWLRTATSEERQLVLDALQVVVTADQGSAKIEGAIPIDSAAFITDEHTCRCSSSGDKPNGIRGAVSRRGGVP